MHAIHSWASKRLGQLPEPVEYALKQAAWALYSLLPGRAPEARSPRSLMHRRARFIRRAREDLPSWLLEDMAKLAVEAEPELEVASLLGDGIVEEQEPAGLAVPGLVYRKLLDRAPERVATLCITAGRTSSWTLRHELPPVAPDVLIVVTGLARPPSSELQGHRVVALADIDPDGQLYAGEDELILKRFVVQLQPTVVKSFDSRIGDRVAAFHERAQRDTGREAAP